MKIFPSIVLSLAGAVMASAQPSGAIANLSTRGTIGQGADSLIAGFVIEGSAPKSVLVRGVGPGLAAFGISNAANAVQIQVYDANGNLVAQNDGFMNDPNASANAQAATQVGAFPLSSPGDSATVVSLAPGAYTVAAVQSAFGTSIGDALLEVYDADGPGAASTIVNLSSRGAVGSADGALMSGFVIAGGAPHDVLINGIGPDLSAFGVANPASSVAVQVLDSNGNQVASSVSAPGFEDALSLDQAMTDSGGFVAGNPGDSIVPVTLSPGAYTVIATPSSTNPFNAVALMEVYDLGVSAPAQ
jgi:hypothetical protein